MPEREVVGKPFELCTQVMGGGHRSRKEEVGWACPRARSHPVKDEDYLYLTRYAFTFRVDLSQHDYKRFRAVFTCV